MPEEEKKDAEGNVIVDVKEAEPWVDPGSKEGVKKDPRVEQNKLTPETPRFQEVYKSMKQGEAKIAELEKKINEKPGDSALIEEMRRHNESLEKTIKQMGEGRESNQAGEAVKDLETKLGELKELKKQAREKADFNNETEIDEKMADLRVEIRDAKKGIEDLKKASDDKGKKDSEMSEDDQAEFDAWIDDNTWFSKEPKKKAAAISFEKKIVKEPKFKDSSITEVLEEVRVRVEEKFKPVKGANLVEGSDRTGSGLIPGSVKLSAVELEISKGLGVSPEKYAKQKHLISQEAKK